MAAGRTSKEIAGQLGISESTVNWHIANVFGRLGASSRAEAVALAMRDDQDAGHPVELPKRRTVRLPLPLSSVAFAVGVTLVLGLLGGALLAGWDFTSLPSPPASGAPTAPASHPAQPSASHPAQQTAAPAGVRSPGSPVTPSPLPLGAPALGTVAPVLPALSPTTVPIPVGSAPALPTPPPLPSARLP